MAGRFRARRAPEISAGRVWACRGLAISRRSPGVGAPGLREERRAAFVLWAAGAERSEEGENVVEVERPERWSEVGDGIHTPKSDKEREDVVKVQRAERLREIGGVAAGGALVDEELPEAGADGEVGAVRRILESQGQVLTNALAHE